MWRYLEFCPEGAMTYQAGASPWRLNNKKALPCKG